MDGVRGGFSVFLSWIGQFNFFCFCLRWLLLLTGAAQKCGMTSMFLLLWSLTQQKCDSDSQFVHLPAKTSTLLANSMVSLQRLPINYTQIRRGLWEFLRYDNLQTGIGFVDGLAGGLVLWMHSLTDGVVCSVLDPPTISVHKRSVNESLTPWSERVC